MIGQTISHYKILEKLGEGGMGVVYKAQDTKLDRTVALKFLPAHVSVNEDTKARFIQEAKAAASLNHNNICTIHGVEEHDGNMFIVMEYIEGGTLREKLPYAKVDDALNVAVQIGEALQEAHAKGIVHRDIKSDNVMLTSKGQAKVMDFGLAKLKGSLKLTRTSSTVGTLAYMAPEQVQGGEVDSRSDIFSFGVLLYEMLSGRLPFRGEHEAAMMYSILNEDPDPINKYLPQASPELIHILNRALEKDPVDRYQHVSDMDIDLRRLKKETSKISRKSIPSMPVVEPSAPAGSESSASTLQNEVAPLEKLPRTTTVTLKIPTLASRKMLVWLGPLVLVIAAFIGYLMFFTNTEEEAGERVPIAVADFINQTKEEQLDGLSGMLITSLEQSRRLSVLTRSRMFDILRVIGKGNVDRIDESLGREISRQANVKALVVASISKFDELYIIDMKVLDPEKNEYILTLKEQAKGRSDIPGSIDKLSDQIRIGLKERRTEVEENSQNVAVMTTPNLEAYQAYFRGEELVNKLEFLKAAEEFRKAVAIDSSFALAYYRLAYALSWGGNPGAGDAITKAMKYVERVPEKEKYLIRAEDALTKNEPLLAISIYKELLALYPEDKEANYLLGDYAFHQLDFETAERSLAKVISMDPKHERAYQHLCWTLLSSKRYDDLKRVAQEYRANAPAPTAYSMLAEAYVVKAQFDSALQICAVGLELFPEESWLRVQRGNIYLMNLSFEAAEKEYSRLTGQDKPYIQKLRGNHGLYSEAIAKGAYRKAMETVERLIDLARNEKDKAALAYWMMEKANVHVKYLKDARAAKAAFALAQEYEKNADVWFYFSKFSYYLNAGEYQNARDISDARMKNIVPQNPLIVDAVEAYYSGNYGTAIERLLKIKVVSPLIQYYLAMCYDAINQAGTAITVLEDLRRNYSTFEYGFTQDYADVVAKSYYLTGKAYEKVNERRKAIQSYEKFLELWKHADGNLSELTDAKKRLAAIK